MSTKRKTKSKRRSLASRDVRETLATTSSLEAYPATVSSASKILPERRPSTDKDIDDSRLQLWAAAGQVQAGAFEAARASLRQALRSGANRELVARLLIGSAYSSLGRASMLAERPERGVRQLATSLDLGVPGGSALWLDLLMAEAERCTRQGDDREAIQRWQDIACLLGARTPEHVYHRMSDAYVRNRSGFGGTPEENHCWGDCHKYDLLAFLHEQLEPRLYLEIGVDAGLSLARARGRAIGVDPRPKLAVQHPLSEQATLVSLSSDAFFRERAEAMLQPSPELVFIDGMHLFEFALRDFMNVERHAAPATLVVIDDIYPCHPTQAARRRRSGAWTGDIWKLHRILRERRPDLTLIALNAHTTGLLLIAGLDPDNRVLWDDYDAIVQRYRDDRAPPLEVLERYGAIPSDHPLVARLLGILRQARDDAWSVAEVRTALAGLTSARVDAERAFLGRVASLAAKTPAPLNTVATLPQVPSIAQLFVPQETPPVYRENSSCAALFELGQWQDVTLRFSLSGMRKDISLRFDPCRSVGLVQIEMLSVWAGQPEKVLLQMDTSEVSQQLMPAHEIAELRGFTVATFFSYGRDPQLLLPVFDLNADLEGAAAQAFCRLRLRIESTTSAMLKALAQVRPDVPASCRTTSCGERKTLIVHIGTHKTGTTSIQQFLRQETEALREEGLYVPVVGTLNAHSGHHNIAWDLRGDARFSSKLGTLGDLIAELACCKSPKAIISAEDFEYLTQYPIALRGFHHLMQLAGWEPMYIGFYRQRVAYQESLYRELRQHGSMLDRVAFQALIEDDAFIFNGDWLYYFDYQRIMAGWKAAIGHAPAFYSYDEAVDSIGLLPRFLQLVGVSEALQEKSRLAPRLNVSQ